MRLPPAVRNTCQCLAVASPQLNPAAIQPQKTSLSSSCLVHTHCLHFTHNGRFRITHTAGPLHFALSPGLKCPFPRSSHGWLLPFHLASARSPTSSKKPSRAINPPHNSHEQTSTFGSGPRAGCLSTPAHVDPHGWLSPLQHYRPSWPPSPPSPPRHYSHSCGRDAVTGQPI